jgi:hypothetical protein
VVKFGVETPFIISSASKKKIKLYILRKQKLSQGFADTYLKRYKTSNALFVAKCVYSTLTFETICYEQIHIANTQEIEYFGKGKTYLVATPLYRTVAGEMSGLVAPVADCPVIPVGLDDVV